MTAELHSSLETLQDNRICVFPFPTSRNFLHSLTYTPFSLQMRASCQILRTVLHSVLLSYLYLFPRMSLGFLGGTSGKEPACRCRRCKRHWFGPWIGKIPWRGKWQPTPVFLPGKSCRQKSLAIYSPWGHKELDTAEHTRNIPPTVVDWDIRFCT